MGKRQQKLQKKRRRKRRFIWFLVFPVVLLLMFGASYGVYLYKQAEKAMGHAYQDDHDKSELREKRVHPSKDNVSVLFIGIDESEKRGFSDSARSDALMLATFNEEEKSVKLLTIPRDSYVYVKEVDYFTKINHAHSFGGPIATIETVENLLDIPVDYYARLDFEAFMEIVDALNGIEVDVPYTFSEQDSKDKANAITLEAGLQTLTGEEALALARTRKLDNDIERGKRQQEIMKAIADKAATASAIPKYGKIINAVGSNMKTNIMFNEMTAFADYVMTGELTIETLNLEGQDHYIRNIYYWQLDEEHLEETKNELKAHLNLSSAITDYASDRSEN